MKLIVKIFILFILVLLVLPFFLKDQYGEPLMKLSDLKRSDLGIPQMLERLPEVKRPKIPGESPKVYTWKDEQGQVHYSNQPPPPEIRARSVDVNPDVNVIRMDKHTGESDITRPPEQGNATSSKGITRTTLYTPQTIKKLAEDAEKVEDTLQERKEEYDRAIDQP